jgi:hypothetical protein
MVAWPFVRENLVDLVGPRDHRTQGTLLVTPAAYVRSIYKFLYYVLYIHTRTYSILRSNLLVLASNYVLYSVGLL